MAYLLTRSAKGQHITVAAAPRFIKTSTAKTLGVSAPVCNNLAAFVQVHQVVHEAAPSHVAYLDKHRRDGKPRASPVFNLISSSSTL